MRAVKKDAMGFKQPQKHVKKSSAAVEYIMRHAVTRKHCVIENTAW